MALKGKKPQPASAPAEQIKQEIAAIAAMNVSQLRALWREHEKSMPPVSQAKTCLPARAPTHF
jgi:hypothetical protein